MARLFPKIQPSEIENQGERTVAQVLVTRLPKRVEIFHSFNWLRPNSIGSLREGECDFVLLDSEAGLLFVEVKGGSLEFDSDRREWLRRLPGGERRTLKKDPFAQAQQNMHQIVGLIKEKLSPSGADLPCTYGFAVAFPDCRYEGALPPNIVPELIWDAQKLGEPQDTVRRVFDRFQRPAHRSLSGRELETTREALHPRFALIPVLWRKVQDQEERLQRLTTEQQRILDVLKNQPKAVIHGVAGSGKTMLALAKAQAVARAGMRTLVLCYNRPLKDWLEQAIPESFGDALVIETYHGLVDKLCRQANVTLWKSGDPRDEEFWAIRAPECLMQACERLGPEQKFDAVIVDEGQDFHDLWWDSLDVVFRDPENKGCYYVFLDPNQNLYVDNPSPPNELGPPFSLSTNCRNTALIAEHCASLVGLKHQVLDGAPRGDEPEHLHVRTLREGFSEAGKRVRQWCKPDGGGLKMSQVAVLARGSSEEAWPKDFQTVVTTRNFDRWRDGKGVLIASWRRFKGLEADAIVILEVAMAEDDPNSADRYVARSRAKHLLTVIEVDST